MRTLPQDPPRPITATLKTQCGCTRVVRLQILWPEYRVPLQQQKLEDFDFLYDMQPRATEVTNRVFEFVTCKMSEAGTEALYMESRVDAPHNDDEGAA